MSTNFKIFRIKTSCIIHFTRKKILFVLGPYLLTSTVLSHSRVSKLSVHLLDFSFQLQWEQCCVKQLHLWCGPPTDCYLPPQPTCWDEFETPVLEPERIRLHDFLKQSFIDTENQSGFKWGTRWRGSGMQWHQLDHMQTVCISLQTDNHTNTSSLNSTNNR